MPYCCVSNCNSKSGTGSRMFALPQGKRNEERRKQWIQNINGDDLPLVAFVCENHFADDQFENKRTDNTRPLKATAVPTIFSSNESVQQSNRKGELSTDSPKQKNKKIVVMCRTCLMYKEKQSSSILTLLIYGKTVKEMVLQLIPQIAQTLTDDSYVCNKCVRCLSKCVEFIDNCLEFETKIRDGQLVYDPEEVLQTDEEDSDSECGGNIPPSSMKQGGLKIEKSMDFTESKDEDKISQIFEDELEESNSLKIDSNKNTEEQKEAAQIQLVTLEGGSSPIKLDLSENSTKCTDEILPTSQKKSEESDVIKKDVPKSTMEVKYLTSIIKTDMKSPLKMDSSRKITTKELKLVKILSPALKMAISSSGKVLKLECPRKAPDENCHENGNQKQASQKKSNKKTIIDESKSTEPSVAVRSSKRNRTKRILDDCAKDEEIDAYLTENFEEEDKEKDESVKSPKRGRKRKDVDVDYEVEADHEDEPRISIKEKKVTNKNAVHRKHERETSPELQVLHNPTKGTIRTYERKKKSVAVENSPATKETESSSEAATYPTTQQNTDEIIKSVIPLKTYGRKRETINNENLENTVVVISIENKPAITNSEILKSVSNAPHILDNPTPDPEIPSDGGDKNNSNEIEVSQSIFRCPACHTVYRSKRGIRDHILHIHRILHPSNYEYTCDVCQEEFAESGALEEHRKTHGSPCNFCRTIFSSTEELDLHKNSHPPLYSCIVCNRGFKTELQLKQHVSMHKLMIDVTTRTELPPQPISCQFSCGMKFRYKARMKEHVQLVHLKQKNYKCDTCGKKFGLKSALNVHNRVRHLDEKPFKCHCGVAFKRKDYLRRHEIKHMQDTKTDLFCCDFCDVKLADRDSFEKHLNTHSNIRKYKCNFCELRFVRQNTRFVHERSHNADPKKTFVCQICWKKCATRNEMEMHMARHRRLKRFRCGLCPRTFIRKMLLENHILNTHTVQSRESETA